MTTKLNQKDLRQHFIRTLYDTLDGVISPTPYLEITQGDNVDIKFLDGKGRLPMPNTTEVTVLDIDIASLFFDDFHILYEGVTGVGKTYTSDALFDAVFGREGHFPLRLSGGVLGSSALEPFTVTTLEHGVPKTRIDPEKCEKYGALFIDEINRGDSNEVFQVVDGVIHVNGDTGYLRIPIKGTNRYKSLAIIAAMNPADAQHSAALELDIAGENRFLKFKFPNGVAEAASSQLEKMVSGGLHEKFWTEFSKRTGLTGDWREHYPVIADPQQFSNALNGETKEFIDVALGYVGYDPVETFERNAELMEQGGIKAQFSVAQNNDYQKILEAQKKLKHGFVRRDLRKIRDLSRLLAFIKGVKSRTYEADVQLNDVAAAIGIVLESKTITGTEPGELMTLVNDAQVEYANLHKQMRLPQGYGFRQAVWQSALHAGSEHGFDAYLKTLQNATDQLNKESGNLVQDREGRNIAQTIIKSRILADLVVLEHFSTAHEAEIKTALKEKGEGKFQAFSQLYEDRKSQSSIYEHRLDSIIK